MADMRVPSRPPLGDPALRVLLWALGHGLILGSWFMPSLRVQITRSFMFEVSAGERVVRQWSFDGQRRTVASWPVRRTRAAHGVRYDTSWQALRRVLSPRAVHGIVDDWQHGRAEVHGNAVVLLWFHGLTRRLAKIGREPGPRRPLPRPYVRHDPSANGGETVLPPGSRAALESTFAPRIMKPWRG